MLLYTIIASNAQIIADTAGTNTGNLVLGSSNAIVTLEDPTLDVNTNSIIFIKGQFATIPLFY